MAKSSSPQLSTMETASRILLIVFTQILTRGPVTDFTIAFNGLKLLQALTIDLRHKFFSDIQGNLTLGRMPLRHEISQYPQVAHGSKHPRTGRQIKLNLSPKEQER